MYENVLFAWLRSFCEKLYDFNNVLLAWFLRDWIARNMSFHMISKHITIYRKKSVLFYGHFRISPCRNLWIWLKTRKLQQYIIGFGIHRKILFKIHIELLLFLKDFDVTNLKPRPDCPGVQPVFKIYFRLIWNFSCYLRWI